jgi:hypothetical protein
MHWRYYSNQVPPCKNPNVRAEVKDEMIKLLTKKTGAKQSKAKEVEE